MFKLAAAVLDFYDDPEFIKDAGLFNGSLVSPDKVHELGDTSFSVKIATAAGTHRKFPIYNRTSTAISGQYFNKVAGVLPEEIRKVAGYYLQQAHLLHGLPVPAALAQSFEEPVERTVEFSPRPDDPGVDQGEDVLKIAQSIFTEQADRMTPLEKVAKAVDLSKAAELSGLELSDRVVKDYTPKDFYGPHLREMLAQREILLREDPMMKEAFSKVLEQFPTLGPKEAPFLVHQFDKIAGFSDRYRDGIMDPFYGAWGDIPEVEKKADAAELLNYRLGTVARSDLLKNILGENAASEFVRHPPGAYERWTKEKPAWKSVVDALMKNVPSEKAADTEAAGVNAAVSKVQGESVPPSDRPMNAAPAETAQAKIDVGL